jgi:uncharacterized membrane protein
MSALTPIERLVQWFSRRFFTGLFVVLPIALTVWIVQILYGLINGPLDRVIRLLIAHNHVPGAQFFQVNTDGTIPGAGFLLAIVLLVLIGVVVSNFFGRQIINWIDQVLLNLPVVKTIYNALKQAAQAVQDFSGGEDGKPKFSRVCYVPMPGGSGHLIGFVTSDFIKPDGRIYSSVFLPTSPSPLTGFVVIYPAEDIVLADLSVEQATKMILSFGLVTPKFDLPGREI